MALTADSYPAQPGRPRADQRPHVRADPGPDPRYLVQRGRIGHLQRPPHRRVARLGTQHQAVMGQHGAVAYAYIPMPGNLGTGPSDIIVGCGYPHDRRR
jgi:hypothetical protein